MNCGAANFQIAYSQWVGGNQDPIFYKDLFATSEIPTETRPSRNRSRFSNPELDKLLDEAVNTFDRQKGKELYTRIQEIVSTDVPVFPMWYQSNIVIARKNVGNIQVNASGDWGFVRNLTVTELNPVNPVLIRENPVKTGSPLHARRGAATSSHPTRSKAELQ